MLRLFLVATLFLYTTCAINATLYVPDCRDTYYDEKKPDTDYSTESKLCWRTRSSIEAWTLLHYKIFKSEGGPVPDDVDIENATFHTVLIKDPCHIRFHDYNQPWKDNDTFNSIGKIKPQAGREFNVRPGYRLRTNGVVRNHVFDVTQSVRAWSAGKENHGWIFIQGDDVPHNCTDQSYGILDGCDSGPDYSPRLEVIYHPSFECNIFNDLSKSKQYNSRIPAYSNVCLFCDSNIENMPELSIDMNTLRVDNVQPKLGDLQRGNDSIEFCFVMPLVRHTQKRENEQNSVTLSFTYRPNNREVKVSIPYTSRPSQNLTCEVFKCENGAVVIPGDLNVSIKHVTTTSVVIEGDLIVQDNGVLTLINNSSISISGCTSLAGTLELQIDSTIASTQEIPVLQSQCINGTFDAITLLPSSSAQQPDPCTSLETSQRRENGILSILVSRRNTCQDNDPPYYVWLIVGLSVFALVVVLSVIIIGLVVRRKYSKREEEKLDVALAEAVGTPSRLNTPQATLDTDTATQ